MKLSNIDNVNKVVKAIRKIDDQICNLENILSEKDFYRKDVGGIDGVLEGGFWCNVSHHNDGNGYQIDLIGCYVGIEVYEATLEILKDKKVDLMYYLEQNGVDIDE